MQAVELAKLDLTNFDDRRALFRSVKQLFGQIKHLNRLDRGRPPQKIGPRDMEIIAGKIGPADPGQVAQAMAGSPQAVLGGIVNAADRN